MARQRKTAAPIFMSINIGLLSLLLVWRLRVKLCYDSELPPPSSIPSHFLHLFLAFLSQSLSFSIVNALKLLDTLLASWTSELWKNISIRSSKATGRDQIPMMKPPFLSGVLSKLKLEHLPAYCASVRKASADFLEKPEVPIEPIAIESLLFGSYHTLFPIKFGDGLRWILKSSSNASAASALRSEALPMRLILCEASVPLPDVLAFDATLDNELGCPCILGEMMVHRTRISQDIAHAMVEQSRFSLSTGGALPFDRDGNLNKPSTMRFVDHQSTLERLGNDEEDESALYFEAGPFQDAAPCYLPAIDRAKERKQPLHKGVEKSPAHAFILGSGHKT
ncbi:conserved hypothetical protein [Histoplasma capsulatum H143]|uniref:Uncharacterized protein n=1 Tax=Ajellomyces capsulatus (strain H143) TaxID=544712 RepID=C6H2Y0_AJECH|nr:conserved hypothetical protein [Histoplasma capsulatum H143]